MITNAITQIGYLTSINIGVDGVITCGQTDSIATVTTYVAALEELGYYSEVRIADVEVGDTTEPSESTEYNVAFTVVTTR